MNLAQTKAYMALLKQGWEYSGRDGLGRVVMEQWQEGDNPHYRFRAGRILIDKDGTIVEDASL